MDHSLINPNQIRHYGIDVKDNPFEKMGITYEENGDNFHIPFKCEGTTIYFDTHYPTDYELEQNPHIILTSDKEWDPARVVLGNNYKLSEDAAETERFVSRVKSNREQAIDRDVFCYESDMVLGRMGDGLIEQEMAERLVSAVNVYDYESDPSVDDVIRDAHEMVSLTRHSKITPELVARIFGVGLGKAKEILNKTTQRGIRQAIHPLTKRYRTDHLNLHHNDLNGRWAVDHIESKTKSIRGNTGAFVYSDGAFTEAYPKPKKDQYEAADSLRQFCKDVGVPVNLESDFAKAFVGKHTEFQKVIKKNGIELTFTEPGHHQLHKLDVSIRELRRRWHTKMTARNIPRRVWDFGIEYEAKLMQFIPRGSEDRTGYERVTGKMPDISEFLDFDMWDLVWYFPNTHPSVAQPNKALARWCGVSHKVGSDMCYWLMPVSGIPIADTTVQHVTAEDLRDPEVKQQVDEFNRRLTERLDDTNHQIPNLGNDFYLDDIYDDPAYGDETTTPTDAEYEIPEDMPDADEIETYDKYIGATFLLDPNESPGNVATQQKAKVLRRATDHLGHPIGNAHSNPLLDTRKYEVELEDGTTDYYFANAIAENLWAQCDSEGRQHQVFSDIVDHRKNDRAITIDNGYEQTPSGIKKPKKTTVGWDLLVEFADGSTDWIPLKIVKESNPVELAEYAVANKIQEEPAFKWWVSFVLNKRNRIINKVKKKYWRTTHKFGIRLPKTIDEALRLDAENGNHMWEDAIKKEMKKACVAYEAVEGCTPEQVRANQCDALRGFQEIKCHIIFDVKMDFTRKARFVAGGHMTETPSSLTYSSVVSRDSVKIAFLIAALNNIDIMSCDIGNAYLNAPCRERIWFEAGSECGELKGKACRLVRALYGLKSSGAAWRAMFSNFICEELGFTPTRADPDVYIRKNFKPDGQAYYEYLLVYVDDVLVVSHDPEKIMKAIGKRFEIKNNEYGPPTIYLGAGISKITVDEQECWSMESSKYVKAAVQTIKDLLAEDGRELKTGNRRHKGPLPPNYQPELDTTHECDEVHASRFRQIIGIFRWAIELGRFDIMIEVSLMSQYQAAPREGHLEALYHIAQFLEKNPMKRVVFDPRRVKLDESTFAHGDWTEFYGDVKEEDPPDMPEPLGEPVVMTCFVDANHAGNKVTRRSHTGIIIFLNNAVIQVYSKRQNTVESSTFGSELVAMRIARDLITAMRIKLKCFGVPIDGPANVFGDNEAVYKNTSNPDSTLSKKHNAINYHICREAVAAGIMRVGKEDTQSNIADAFTKLLPYSKKMELLGPLLMNR